MTQFRNVSAYPQDLDGGRMVAPGEVVDLSDEDLKAPYNRAKLDAKEFLEYSDTKVALPTKDELYQRASDLEIEGRSTMTKVELEQAVAEAEADQLATNEEGQG